MSASDISPSPSPGFSGNNAPKYGTLVPNRIFVGGISGSTTEHELYDLFSKYGTVKATKIIVDRAGISKGYGFVTFDSEDDVDRLKEYINQKKELMLKDRRLNIAPAVKKQPFSRSFDGTTESPSPAVCSSGAPVVYANSMPPVNYHQGNNVAYVSPDAYNSVNATFGYVYPPTVYVQQPIFQNPQTEWSPNNQWRWPQPVSYIQTNSPTSPPQCTYGGEGGYTMPYYFPGPTMSNDYMDQQHYPPSQAPPTAFATYIPDPASAEGNAGHMGKSIHGKEMKGKVDGVGYMDAGSEISSSRRNMQKGGKTSNTPVVSVMSQQQHHHHHHQPQQQEVRHDANSVAIPRAYAVVNAPTGTWYVTPAPSCQLPCQTLQPLAWKPPIHRQKPMGNNDADGNQEDVAGRRRAAARSRGVTHFTPPPSPNSTAKRLDKLKI